MYNNNNIGNNNNNNSNNNNTFLWLLMTKSKNKTEIKNQEKLKHICVLNDFQWKIEEILKITTNIWLSKKIF